MHAQAFSMTRFIAESVLLAAALLSAAPALADAGNWIVPVRAIQLAPDVSSQVTVIGGSVDIDADELPELDFTYFITNNWAAELILATTRHRVTESPSHRQQLDIGQCGPRQSLAATSDPDTAAPLTVTVVSYEDNFSWALQAGIDIGINERWAINFDLKKAYLSSDVNLNNGAILADVDLDPWVFGIGFAYRF